MSYIDMPTGGRDAPLVPRDRAQEEPPKDDAKQTDFIRTMRKRYDRGVNRDQVNRNSAREDLNFKVGDQWPQAEVQRRGADRPTLTFPKLLPIIRQVTGDVRQNKPAIKVRPKGDGADKATANVFGGLIRDIEERSSAGYVYAQGIDNAVSCGFGAWRITTEYSSDDSFDQDIRIKGIPNALSVVWDPDAIELDRSDARWCFVYSSLPVEEFKTAYPDAKVADFDKKEMASEIDQYGDWFSREGAIRVAEYWCKEPVLKTLCQLSDGRVICKDDYQPDELSEVLGGATVAKERTVKADQVVQHIVSGAEELEPSTKWLGRWIPIIYVPGEETWVDEKRVTYGLIRFAKDSQRAYNYARSTSIEVVALQPKAPYVLSATMIAGYEFMWQNAGSTAYPYLLYHMDPAAPQQVPHRLQPPTQPTGLVAEAQIASSDIRDATGIYQASLGQKSNETSGVAIDNRKHEGDVSTFVYIDNGAMAIANTGRQLIDLIPKIYDTRRVQRILFDDGTDDQVVLNHPIIGPDGRQMIRHDPPAKFFDLTIGKYDVSVSTGPSFTTRRQEAASGMLDLMKTAPATAPILAPRLAKMQDWPGADDVAEDLQKLLPPQLQPQPKGPDGQPLPLPPPAPTPPDPALMKMQAEMEMRSQSAQNDNQIEQGKLDLLRMQSQAKAEALQAEQRMEVAQANHRADLAERDFALRKWIAEQNVDMERETISAKIGMQQEAADREAIISGAPSIQEAQQQTQDAVQGLGHLVHSMAVIHAAPTVVVKHPETGETLGVQKQVPPELAEQLHPAVRQMAEFKPVVRDRTGAIVALADKQPETVQ